MPPTPVNIPVTRERAHPGMRAPAHRRAQMSLDPVPRASGLGRALTGARPANDTGFGSSKRVATGLARERCIDKDIACFNPPSQHPIATPDRWIQA